MPTLSEYTNVYDTALDHLAEEGYQVWFEEETQLFYAEKDGWDFAAESPVGLLGLIFLHVKLRPQQYREYWWRRETAHRIASLPRKPLDYRPVWADRGREPEAPAAIQD